MNASSLQVSNTHCELEFLVLRRTHWAIWVFLLEPTVRRNRGFVVSWSTIPQSPPNIFSDLRRVLPVLRTFEKLLH